MLGSCPTGWEKFDKNCYLFQDTDLQPWTVARYKCQKQGGNLVSITSQQEQDFITFHYQRRLLEISGSVGDLSWRIAEWRALKSVAIVGYSCCFAGAITCKVSCICYRFQPGFSLLRFLSDEIPQGMAYFPMQSKIGCDKLCCTVSRLVTISQSNTLLIIGVVCFSTFQNRIVSSFTNHVLIVVQV